MATNPHTITVGPCEYEFTGTGLVIKDGGLTFTAGHATATPTASAIASATIGSSNTATPTLNNPLTTANVGAKNGSTVTVVEKGDGILHQTVFTLTALPLTLADATTGGGVKLYDFPQGVITILGASGSVAETTTSELTSTLNASKTYNWGVGTVTQANGTLATTEQDILPSTNGTSSATIDVAGAASAAKRTDAPANFDGSGTAIAAFFNVGLATADDIDGDATTTWTGTITVSWIFNGDV